MRIAIIKNGFVETVLIADKVSDVMATYPAKQGYTIVPSEGASPKDKWDGKVFTTPVETLPLNALTDYAKEERIRRIYVAYISREKRVSLYGYLAQLNAYEIAGKLTDVQKLDRDVLLAAAEWEQAMIDAAKKNVKSGRIEYIIRDDAWPVLEEKTRKALHELAEQS